MKTLYLILLFTDGLHMSVESRPFAVPCAKAAKLLNAPQLTEQYKGEKGPDGRIIESVKWVCR